MTFSEVVIYIAAILAFALGARVIVIVLARNLALRKWDKITDQQIERRLSPDDRRLTANGRPIKEYYIERDASVYGAVGFVALVLSIFTFIVVTQ